MGEIFLLAEKQISTVITSLDLEQKPYLAAYMYCTGLFYDSVIGNSKQAFLDISKKTQAQKKSKLKENLEKTQAKLRKNSKTGNSS